MNPPEVPIAIQIVRFKDEYPVQVAEVAIRAVLAREHVAGFYRLVRRIDQGITWAQGKGPA
ncbi:MAG: hypothetical protein PVH65_01760 [Chloroflexota bacterium]|jgi:phosphatidate phosphatase APP1